jgi:hypothetical protein
MSAKRVGNGPPPELRRALIEAFMAHDMDRYGDATSALRKWLSGNPRTKDERVSDSLE